MAGIFTQIAALLSVFQILVQMNDQSVQVTEERLQQHEEQHSQVMALVMDLLRREEQYRQEMALVTDLLQREEQRNQEMSLLLEILQRSQEESEGAQENLLLSACQQWWFWASAEMLLVLFAFCWLSRHGSPGYDGDGGSAGEETPAEPGRRRRRRKRTQTTVTSWMTGGLRLRVSF